MLVINLKVLANGSLLLKCRKKISDVIIKTVNLSLLLRIVTTCMSVGQAC